MAANGEGVRVIDRGPKPAKRVLTIEQALRWAYRDELPKARPDGTLNLGEMASAWDKVARYGEHMSIIDLNPYGVCHDPMALGAPHPDAERIALAVNALDQLALEIPDDWEPFTDLGDMGPLGEDARQRAVAQLAKVNLTPRYLIVKNAVLREPPDWYIDRPAVKYRMGDGGRGSPKLFRKVTWTDPQTGHSYESEEDGYDAKAKRAHPGAYTKQYLDPDPCNAAVFRAEWQVWVAALDVLAIDLEDQLESITVRPSGRSMVPWTEDRREGRVLPDLSKCFVRPMMLRDGEWVPVDIESLVRERWGATSLATAYVAARDRQPKSGCGQP